MFVKVLAKNNIFSQMSTEPINANFTCLYYCYSKDNKV